MLVVSSMTSLYIRESTNIPNASKINMIFFSVADDANAAAAATVSMCDNGIRTDAIPTSDRPLKINRQHSNRIKLNEVKNKIRLLRTQQREKKV